MDLFKYLADELGVLATESELNEIRLLVLGKEKYIAESNVIGALPTDSPFVCETCKFSVVKNNNEPCRSCDEKYSNYSSWRQ
jgi:rubrerythrin